MSDAKQETAPETGPTVAELAERQERTEGKLDQILEVLGKTKDTAHDKAADHEAEKLNEPTSVADEIRRQLEERDQADQAKKAGEEQQSWRAGVDAKLGELAEKKPESPARKVEKIMGWR
jgi:hypothetical protein